MALEIKLSQKLSQTLVMTPQLQQAIKLLQLGRMEYSEMIERELLENPVLEDGREDNQEERTGQDAQTESTYQSGDPFSSIDEGEDNHSQETTGAEIRARTESAPEAAPGELLSFGYSSTRSGSDSERSSIESIVSAREGLTSHLLWQVRTTDFDAEDQDIFAQIVGNLDRNGYLAMSVQEIANECRKDPADVERVVKLVQTLDPPGIAARDLRECLLIQLDQLGMNGTLAWRIVDEHLGELEIRRYEVIAKKEQVTLEAVYQAVKEIQKLEPRPGRPFTEDEPIYITPDVYVRKVGSEYVITLNEAGMPKIRVNPLYQQLLIDGRNGTGIDREYLQERLRSASWLIKSIHQRQQTIYRVTESIVKFQRDFLEHGVASLKPLVLRDVAADVGMHESTVSRVTTNKYVHTPQGVFELKFFFTSGLKSDGGEISSESVKERIREVVAAENPRKPLSDQAIVAMLRAEGIDIARRTVAKYREMMNILSSSRRKKMF